MEIIQPILPLLSLFEFMIGMVHKKTQTKEYKIYFLIYFSNRFIGRFIAVAVINICIGFFQKHAHFQNTLTYIS